jgi:hypothetical protein
LLGASAVVLAQLGYPKTVTATWERLRSDPAIRTFDRFVMALDLLFLMGLLELNDGLLTRTGDDNRG